MITVIDYGCGNLGSIVNMLSKLHIDCRITSSAAEIEDAHRLVLPGVGTFDSGMRGIEERGLREVLDKKALVDRIPILGVCLGAQLMTRGSQEGISKGLGWLDADTVKFSFNGELSGLPLPNIGWRDVVPVHEIAPFQLSDDGEIDRFYFVHKYHFQAPKHIIWMWSHYGYDFPCALRHGNLLSVQFHPEKSHRFGMRLITRFSELG